MVRLTRVSRHYGDNRAVDDVSLGLDAGAFLTILGPSGCGKTTLLRMIAGFIATSAGRIEIQGQPDAALPPWLKMLGLAHGPRELVEPQKTEALFVLTPEEADADLLRSRSVEVPLSEL